MYCTSSVAIRYTHTVLCLLFLLVKCLVKEILGVVTGEEEESFLAKIKI